MAEKVVVEFDQHSKEYQARGMQIGAEIRSKCPVAWSENYGGYWIITGLEEASAIYKRPELFSALNLTWKDPDSMFRGIQIPNNPAYGENSFLEMDPPEQLQYRRVLNSHLSPAAVVRWEPFVAEFTGACIDEIIEQGHGDFVEDIVNVVPALLTMAMIGFPLADWDVYCEPTHAQVYTPAHSPDRERVNQITMQMGMRTMELIAQMRANPRPGMCKDLIDAEIGGQRLSDATIAGQLGLVIGGGFDTTTALTSNAFQWLFEHPEDKARLMGFDEGLWNTATEEFLRYFSPSQGDARTAIEDCEVMGYQFKKGDRVLPSFSISNRDPRFFPDPDTLDIERFPNRHAAFGLGNHRCIGSNLARMNFKAMLMGTLKRIPEYEVDVDGVERYETIGIINGNKTMPFSFPAGKKVGPGLAATIEKWQQILDDEAAAAS
jgi:cytochrome P450